MKIYLSTGKVKKEWTDYNGHMNLAFYIHLFDTGWEVMLNKFDMGEQAAKTEKKKTLSVESHSTYYKEVKDWNEVDINLLFLDIDNKRLVYKLEMTHKDEKYRAATTEVCSLYVDLSKRKVAEFEPLKKQKINDFIQQNKINFEEKDLKLLSKLKK